jgi:hypothetical protein
MNRKGQLISSDEATPAKGQHVKPCSDCPWTTRALPGWTGGIDPADWLADVHGEAIVCCHVHEGAQCAGAAIYRANVYKSPRNLEALRLPANRLTVFTSPAAFLAHHNKPPKL